MGQVTSLGHVPGRNATPSQSAPPAVTGGALSAACALRARPPPFDAPHERAHHGHQGNGRRPSDLGRAPARHRVVALAPAWISAIGV